MKDQAKCFILAPDGYEEITYAELTNRREIDPAYHNRRFILLHGMLLEVSETDYRDFYRMERRQKYVDEEASRAGLFSYNALDGEDILIDNSLSIEDTVSDKLMLETLQRGLDKLSEDDHALLTALYFDEKSERELAKNLGITQQAVSKRHQKAIKILKSLIGF